MSAFFNKVNYRDIEYSKSYSVEIAEKLLSNVLDYAGERIYEFRDKSFFGTEIEGLDVKNKQEYVFSLSYLTYTINAYKQTGDTRYKEIFEKIFSWYLDYISDMPQIIPGGVSYEMPILEHIRMLILASDVYETIPREEEWHKKLLQYAQWLLDKKNKIYVNNHGLFQVIALLYLSVFLKIDKSTSTQYQENAIEHAKELMRLSYYEDGTNVEHSAAYFKYNNEQYTIIFDFCKYYNLTGIEEVEKRLNKARESLVSIARMDNTLPFIGDGGKKAISSHNDRECIFKDLGLAVIKKGDLYLSYKAKTTKQDHAHADMSSVTMQYKNKDILMDGGIFNFDRFTPINRIIRSTAGHCGFYPIGMDKVFLWELVDKIKKWGINFYNFNHTQSVVCGEYHYEDTLVKREIRAKADEVIIIDSFKSKKAKTMRQRFILPHNALRNSEFNISKRQIKYFEKDFEATIKIETDINGAYTIPNLSVYAPDYNEYKTALCVDTYIEGLDKGQVAAVISITDKE